jgi:hypothetical protein
MATKKTVTDLPADTLVRVLVECSLGQVDDVIELTPEQLTEAVTSGQVDPDPDAVAYAQSLI